MKRLAVEAGNLILDIYNSSDSGINHSLKSDESPVTKADILANNHIVENLKKEFPDYSILSEESADDLSRLKNSFCFLVDPLDGTKEFIKRTDEFTVNIALSRNYEIVAGVIYAPAVNDLYFAAKSAGAFRYFHGKETEISVSDITTNPRIAVSRSHRTAQEDLFIEKNNISQVIEAGSSIKGCLIARGDTEIYYRHGRTMEWDTAAMQIIIEEAGGEMKNADGSRIEYNKENPENRSFIATNGKIRISL